MWIEIFKKGTHVSSDGMERTFGEEDLDRAVKSFSSNVPVLLGHQKPNYELAEIKQVKHEGGILYGLLDDSNIDKFRTIVTTGLNRVSAGFANIKDMVLDHVALLGSTPNPAIKDLKAIQFQEDKNIITIEFNKQKEELQMPDEKFFESWLSKLENLFQKKIEPGSPPAQFDEGLVKKLIDTKIGELKADYETKISSLEKSNKDLKEQLDKSQILTEKSEFSAYLDSEELKDRVTPALKAKILGLLDNLDYSTEVEFEEGDKKIKMTKLALLKELTKSLPSQVSYNEFAVDGRSDRISSEDIDKMVEAYEKGKQI